MGLAADLMRKWEAEEKGWDLENCPPHYVKEFDMTFQWLPNSYESVQEYNVWRGNPDPDEEIERTRRIVRMELHHEAILKLHELFKNGDMRAIKALYLCYLSDMTKVTLGYDFQLGCPTVTHEFYE